jgi:uncharacterized damage-inducible protein DinB
MNQEHHQVFIAAIKQHLFDENWPRLKQCLELCDKNLLWFRANDNTNSIGNLVLHLKGNLTQWVLHGIGGAPDRRNRDLEFIPNQSISATQLITDFEKLISDLKNTIDKLEPHNLIESKKVQGFNTSVYGILIHVTEHFSYHLGQISMLVKQSKNIDLKYYGGVDLNYTD